MSLSSGSFPSAGDVAASEGVPVQSIRIIRTYTERVSETMIRYVTVYEITREYQQKIFESEYQKVFRSTTWQNEANAAFHRMVALIRVMYLSDGLTATSSGSTFRSKIGGALESIHQSLIHRRKVKPKEIDLSQLTVSAAASFSQLTEKDIPTQSGVYVFRAFGFPLYVGSAANYRNRFKRYFRVLNGKQEGEFEGEKLLAAWHQFSSKNMADAALSLQIVPCVEYKDVEAALIAELDPPFNAKDERTGVDDSVMEWLRRKVSGK